MEHRDILYSGDTLTLGILENPHCVEMGSGCGRGEARMQEILSAGLVIHTDSVD